MHGWSKCLQQQQVLRRGMPAGMWFCLVFAFLLAACAKQPTTKHLYTVGETAEADGWQVTVHSFSILPADPWHQPKEGYVLCAVEVTLRNRSGKILYVMPEKQMTLLNGENRAYVLDSQANVMAARLHNWFVPQGGLEPGQEVHGAAAYQVPADAQDLRWAFRAGLMPWSHSVLFFLGALPEQ